MIKVTDITKSYGSRENRFPVLKGISLEIKDGSFAVILGASGAGKSTLLNVISGLEPPDGGRILYDDTDITLLSDQALTKFRKETVGFIFQQYFLLPNMNVEQNVKMGADLAGNHQYKAVIQAVGLGEMLHKYPAEISGGEKQRTAVARALINNPLVILADEPTGNLDSKSSRAVIGSFMQAQRELGATIFMVTHDSFSASFCDRVIILRDGTIYRTLVNRSGQSAFQDELLDVIREMGKE